MSLLKLTGGPRAGAEAQIEDMNHLAILYPGYTPVSQAIDPELGELVTDAEWTGSDFDEAAYSGVLNPLQADSMHDHPEDDADQQHLASPETAPEGTSAAPEPPPLPESPQVAPEPQASSEGPAAPPPPEVPQAPATP